MPNDFEEIKRKIDQLSLSCSGNDSFDIEVLDLNNGILTIRLMSNCKSCAIAKTNFEQIWKERIIQLDSRITDVELYQPLDQSIIDLAKNLLSQSKLQH